jgi:hypothetical protein
VQGVLVSWGKHNKGWSPRSRQNLGLRALTELSAVWLAIEPIDAQQTKVCVRKTKSRKTVGVILTEYDTCC